MQNVIKYVDPNINKKCNKYPTVKAVFRATMVNDS